MGERVKLKKKTIWLFFFAISFLIITFKAYAHSGKTNSEGCHNQTSNNSYHCHQSSKKNNRIYSYSKKNIKVIDGDTIHIGDKKIRFSGIDTPEMKQTCRKEDKIIMCGVLAKKFLEEQLEKSFMIKCIEEASLDRYNRVLAECFIDNKSLSSLIVKSGYGFSFRKYSKKFIEDEDFAKDNKNGLWDMEFEYPWNYRRN